MKHTDSYPHRARGNALLLVLVAIALIAALTLAVTRSDVTDADSVTPEHARIVASNILSQARIIEETFKNLIARGCSEQNISFDNPVIDTDYDHADTPSDGSCSMFDQRGGGLTWPIPMAGANDGVQPWMFLAGNAINGLTQTDDGTCSSGCIDLMTALPNVPLAVCQQINILSGVTDHLIAPPLKTGDFNTLTKIAGFDATGIGNGMWANNQPLYGKRTGCFMPDELDGGPTTHEYYWFYHVILAR